MEEVERQIYKHLVKVCQILIDSNKDGNNMEFTKKAERYKRYLFAL